MSSRVTRALPNVPYIPPEVHALGVIGDDGARIVSLIGSERMKKTSVRANAIDDMYQCVWRSSALVP